MEHWRRALPLLPPGSAQHARVTATLEALRRRADAAPAQAGPSPGDKRKPRRGPVGTALAVLGALLLKFKVAVIFALTKAKLLLVGLTKVGTLFSMLLSFGVYWAVWGWKFAAGLVLSIYVHEMGHVFALTQRGIPATAPMFIPGVGAVVRLKQYPSSPREDARIGLAGPIWGLGAALAAYLMYRATHAGAFAAIAEVGAWINLFNLLPVWQLDGGRGFRALDRAARLVCVGVIGLMWVLTAEGLLLLLLIAAGVRAVVGPFPEETDRRALLEYALLVVALSAMTLIDIPGVTR